MKTIMAKIPVLMFCILIMMVTSAYGQQGKERNAAKKETNQDDKKTAKEITDESKDKVIKQAKDHDIEQPDQDKTEVTHKGKPGDKSQARMHHELKAQELGTTVTQADDKVKEARSKIEEAKLNLEKDKKTRKISDADYKMRKEKIDKAEAAVNELEQKVQKGKALEKPAKEPASTEAVE